MNFQEKFCILGVWQILRYSLRIWKRNSAAWRTVFDIAQKKNKIVALQKESESPEFWQDPKTSGKLSKELADLKEEVEEFDGVQQEFTDLKELAELSKADEDAKAELPGAVELLEKRLEKQEIRTFLSGKYDRANAILSVSAGAGGQDAQDWAAMLQRMYERYCEKKGWRTEAIHRSFGEAGADGRIGVKQASFQVSGSFAYGLLKRETGVHRLVRMSPFSAKQLRHTSFAAVEVTPEIDIKQEKDIEIKPEDITVEFFNASGPGGQNVNKRETAVRLVHKPSGIVVTSQASRFQQQNREKAMQVLASKLYLMREQEREKEFARMRGKQAAIEWGSQIRSYVLHPYKLVRDMRTNVETTDAESVLDGDLDIFIEAALRPPAGGSG